MYYDKARDGNVNRDFIDTFGGLNRRRKIGENEFSDIRNMTAHHYPLLASKKTFVSEETGITNISRGLCWNDDKLWYCFEDDDVLKITYNAVGAPVYTLGEIKEENLYSERQMINFGAYIIIMPDKLYINTADTTDLGSTEKVFRNIDDAEHYNRWYVVKPCDIDGNEFVADSYSATEPTTNLYDGYIWYDLNEKVIKQWSSSYSMWITPTIYHKYRIQGIGIFKEGDGVEIRRYIDNEEYSMTTTIVKAFSNGEAPSGETPPLDADYIIIPSADDMAIRWRLYSDNKTLYNQWRNLLSVEQKMPKMDYLIECQGRLWGCRYGDTETDEIRQYRKRLQDNARNVPTVVEIPIADNGETVGEILTYWLYTDEYEKITDSRVSVTAEKSVDEKKITVTISWGESAPYYLGTANLNVNYTVLTTQKLNEIYSSKQQDFKCWDYFQGTALDSYTVNIGASGRFTGAVNFNGKPLFSKEDRMFVIYGNYPAQYQLQENVFEGVEFNAHKSMVVYNGVLYYKGRHGIYAYSGGLPQRISEALGDIRYVNKTSLSGTTRIRVRPDPQLPAHWETITWDYSVIPCCAMAYNGVYYIHLQDTETTNTTGVYRYDIEKGIWHLGTVGKTPIQMLSCIGKAYALNVYASLGVLNSQVVTVEDDTATQPFGSWSAETGIIGLNTPDEKYIKKITMRYKGNCNVYIDYDSEGTFSEQYELSGGLTSKTFSIIPKRCDHFRLKFEGDGEFYLYSIAKTIDTGSDETYGNT